jgi:hypothetical protein
MNKILNNDIKILLDAFKYTSNIIVEITNKLNDFENKIKKIENNISKIANCVMELKSKINYIEKLNNNSKLKIDSKNIPNKVILHNNIELDKNKDNCEKVNDKITENIIKDKNKINNLIESILKKKKTLDNIMENNKDKSLLTDYIIDETNTIVDEKTSKEINEKTINETNTIINTNSNNNLKNIRKKRNFAKRF